ncbi:hypothetical protein N7509_006259 [Penicillium cosmopolitanum]|uniref:Uncharacterized protein n=1 Tax=Penicillium cosmopolitanum TaxID=1131564 RepID=A0A9X0BAT0_9EURO|nr:uncharacterized protein N7509_006259 [Penicillium cosmopolitanum]KAJ5398146.1 hypothetical protein N7509_006259 [Penicillium cosmopolitanum]
MPVSPTDGDNHSSAFGQQTHMMASIDTINSYGGLHRSSSPGFGPPSKTLPKPPGPYQCGWRFTAQEHIQPKPTPITNDSMINTQENRHERSQLSPLEHCQQHPPLPGSMGSRTLDLQIQTLLQVADEHRSQVFTVKLCGQSGNYLQIPQSTLAAKVFDPFIL